MVNEYDKWKIARLKGIRRKWNYAEWISSKKSLFAALKDSRVVTGAGDNGALNIWLTDEGIYRASAMRYRQVEDSIRTTDINKLQNFVDRYVGEYEIPLNN